MKSVQCTHNLFIFLETNLQEFNFPVKNMCTSSWNLMPCTAVFHGTRYSSILETGSFKETMGSHTPENDIPHSQHCMNPKFYITCHWLQTDKRSTSFHQNFSRCVTMHSLEYRVPQDMFYCFLSVVSRLSQWLCPVVCILL